MIIFREKYCSIMIRPFLLIIGAFVFASCAENEAPYVLMISFDGFRHDYASRQSMLHFEEFIAGGTQAEGLIPSFPSKTFPNHYSLITGMYPGNHKLVDNNFYDPTRSIVFNTSDRDIVEDPEFYGGTPLWQLAKQQGIRTASYFWVGSEAPIQGTFPDYYYLYDGAKTNEERVDQVIDWLNLPPKERPHLITLYFSLVDSEGHSYGPDSPEVARTLAQADSLIGNLMGRIAETSLPVNTIIVSDHGMLGMTSEEESFVYLKDILNANDSSFVMVNGGAQNHIYSRNARVIDSLYSHLKGVEQNFKVYKKENFPARWHYTSETAGDLLMVVDSGYYLVDATREAYASRLKPGLWVGNHGYDPDEVVAMRGIFYANGPNIKSGMTIPAFRNVHVYPLVARILELEVPSDIDGDSKVLEAVYQEK